MFRLGHEPVPRGGIPGVSYALAALTREFTIGVVRSIAADPLARARAGELTPEKQSHRTEFASLLNRSVDDPLVTLERSSRVTTANRRGELDQCQRKVDGELNRLLRVSDEIARPMVVHIRSGLCDPFIVRSDHRETSQSRINAVVSVPSTRMFHAGLALERSSCVTRGAARNTPVTIVMGASAHRK
jgi:hypothetical protein